MNENLKKLEKDGVVLLKNVFPKQTMDDVKNEYDKLDKDLTRQEILKDQPVIIFWKHVIGEQKRLCTFKEFPTLWNLIDNHIVKIIQNNFQDLIKKLQLLETIIFNKPFMVSNKLHWHQDVSYFPLKPNNQLAVWIPFESVTKDAHISFR